MRELIDRNELEPERIVSCIFTSTHNLNAEFPAVAARNVGLDTVPLLCAQEIDVPGAMPGVIRVLVHYYAPGRPRARSHLHRRGPAAALRPAMPPSSERVALRVRGCRAGRRGGDGSAHRVRLAHRLPGHRPDPSDREAADRRLAARHRGRAALARGDSFTRIAELEGAPVGYCFVAAPGREEPEGSQGRRAGGDLRRPGPLGPGPGPGAGGERASQEATRPATRRSCCGPSSATRAPGVLRAARLARRRRAPAARASGAATLRFRRALP